MGVVPCGRREMNPWEVAVYYDRLDEARAMTRQFERDAAHWHLECEARSAAAECRGR